MKRFTSFLCALLVLMSASATTITAPQLKSKRLGEDKVENPHTLLSKQSHVVKPTLRAPQAKSAVTNVVATYFQSVYSAGNSFVMNSLVDQANGVEYDFAIIPAVGETTIQSGRTYTIEDMNDYYCYWFDNNWDGADFAQVSFTWTKAEDGAETVVVDATDNLGAQFHITYEKAAPAPVVIPVEINFTKSVSMEYYAETTDWYIVAQNDDYALSLDILSDNTITLPAGSYETADFNLNYMSVIDIAVSTNNIQVTSAAAEVSKTGNRTDIIAVLTCANGKTYRATMFYEPIVITDTTNVVITSVTSTDYQTDIYYVLKNEAGDSIFYFDIYKSSATTDVTLGQKYTKSDMMGSYSYMKFGSVSKQYSTAEFTKTKDEAGLVRIETFVTDKDGNAYSLLYQEKGVEPTGDTITLHFDSAMAVPQYYEDGSWEMYTTHGKDTAAYFVFVNNNSVSPAGTYTQEDLVGNYSGIVLNGSIIYMQSATFTVTDTNERIDLVASVLGKDGNIYDITMFFIKPQAQSQETITANNLTINTDYFTWYGIGIFKASDETNTIAMTINLNGVGADMAGSYVAGVDFNGEITPNGGVAAEIYSGTVTIAIAESGNVTLTGSVLANNMVEYTLNLTYVKPAPQVFNLTISSATAEYQPSYGRVRYTLGNSDFRFFFSIYLEENQEDVVLGKTYGFLSDMRGNANASYGMYLDGSYTYVDYQDASFIKTKEDNVLKIEVSILDIDGNTWNLKYNTDVTALGNVQGDKIQTTKVLRDGQLIIEKNGKAVNVMGQTVR